MGKVLIIACTNVGRAIIDAISCENKLQGIDLVGVINLKPEIATEKANYDAYTDLIKKYNLNMYYCENVNEPECINFIRTCNPDIIIQSGWSQKFNQELLNIPKYGCIGEHPAPLPRGRGAACVNWAILTGEKNWGDTFFKMEMEYDTGEILAQELFNIEEYDDVKTIYDKVAFCARRSVVDNLENWTRGVFNSIKQNDSLATHYPRRKPSDGEFSFNNKNSSELYDFIRAQAKPYPGAFFIGTINEKKHRIIVWKASLGEKSTNSVSFQCKDGKCINLLRVQMDGLPEMWAKDLFELYDIVV